MKAIEIENLSFSYTKDQEVLKQLNLEIELGSHVCIIGHNGSGKSTLAKLIIGLLEGKSGSIKVMENEVNEKNIHTIREKVGIVFQNPDNQFIGSTVRDDIAFGLENRRIPQEKMDDVIDEFSKKVGMFDFLDQEPSNLSGGQKQRVALAGVLAMNPDILILDEATAMLDPKGRKEILTLVSKMKGDNPNLTIISITHDIEEAYLASRVVVLSDGKIMFDGIPNEVFSHYEELLNIDLDIPFLVRLKRELKNKGIDLDDALNEEEVVRRLCQ